MLSPSQHLTSIGKPKQIHSDNPASKKKKAAQSKTEIPANIQTVSDKIKLTGVQKNLKELFETCLSCKENGTLKHFQTMIDKLSEATRSTPEIKALKAFVKILQTPQPQDSDVRLFLRLSVNSIAPQRRQGSNAQTFKQLFDALEESCDSPNKFQQMVFDEFSHETDTRIRQSRDVDKAKQAYCSLYGEQEWVLRSQAKTLTPESATVIVENTLGKLKMSVPLSELAKNDHVRVLRLVLDELYRNSDSFKEISQLELKALQWTFSRLFQNEPFNFSKAETHYRTITGSSNFSKRLFQHLSSTKASDLPQNTRKAFTTHLTEQINSGNLELAQHIVTHWPVKSRWASTELLPIVVTELAKQNTEASDLLLKKLYKNLSETQKVTFCNNFMALRTENDIARFANIVGITIHDSIDFYLKFITEAFKLTIGYKRDTSSGIKAEVTFNKMSKEKALEFYAEMFTRFLDPRVIGYTCTLFCTEGALSKKASRLVATFNAISQYSIQPKETSTALQEKLALLIQRQIQAGLKAGVINRKDLFQPSDIFFKGKGYWYKEDRVPTRLLSDTEIGSMVFNQLTEQDPTEVVSVKKVLLSTATFSLIDLSQYVFGYRLFGSHERPGNSIGTRVLTTDYVNSLGQNGAAEISISSISQSK